VPIEQSAVPKQCEPCRWSMVDVDWKAALANSVVVTTGVVAVHERLYRVNAMQSSMILLQ
jgi:hypothetical protein